jgi:hypothetical protein
MKGGGPIPKVKNYVQRVSVLPVSVASSSCDLRITGSLINIQPALAGVPTGNFLRIEAVTGGQLAVYDTGGNICGYFDSADNNDLLQCMSLGNRYKGRLRHDRSTVDVQKTR